MVNQGDIDLEVEYQVNTVSVLDTSQRMLADVQPLVILAGCGLDGRQTRRFDRFNVLQLFRAPCAGECRNPSRSEMCSQ